MRRALLIHDDVCGCAYVYIDGLLELEVSKSEESWSSAVADALSAADEAAETEGTVDRCGFPPEDLSGWRDLEPIERYGQDGLRAIIDAYSLGVVGTLVLNAEYIFGEDFFFPGGDGSGWS